MRRKALATSWRNAPRSDSISAAPSPARRNHTEHLRSDPPDGKQRDAAEQNADNNGKGMPQPIRQRQGEAGLWLWRGGYRDAPGRESRSGTGVGGWEEPGYEAEQAVEQIPQSADAPSDEVHQLRGEENAGDKSQHEHQGQTDQEHPPPGTAALKEQRRALLVGPGRRPQRRGRGLRRRQPREWRQPGRRRPRSRSRARRRASRDRTGTPITTRL